jgi:hypothetical protein
MWIERISISNFRSYGSTAQILSAQSGLNVIVGENNTGKSTILAAVLRAHSHGELGLSDRPWGAQGGLPRIEVTVHFDPRDSEVLYHQLFGPILAELQRTDNLEPTEDQIAKVKKQFCDAMVLRSWTTTLLGGVSLNGQLMVFTDIRPQHSLRDIFSTILRERRDVGMFFKDMTGSLDLHNNVSAGLDNFFTSRTKAFADIRQRPQGLGSGGAGVEESFGGHATADLLMNLKNGPIQQRQKYRTIQERFTSFFPSLDLEVVGSQGGQPSIVFNRKGHAFDIPPDQTGTGVFEILTILTNLEGRSGFVFFIEEPGSHLHPQGQRALQRLILESSKVNQIFLLTHSPEFVNWVDLKGLTRVWMKDGVTYLSPFPSNLTANEEAALFNALRDIEKREMLFARAVLLVEGETERAFISSVAPKLDVNLDALGISVISVDGEDQYMPYIRFLDSLEIPFRCLRDKPGGGSAPGFQKYFKFAGAEFEDLMTKAGYGGLLRDAEAGRSKVRKGRYIGDRFDPTKIPTVYIESLKEIEVEAKTA